MENITESIKVTSLENGIVKLTLNIPDQLNALSREVLQRLSQLLQEVQQDNATKGIIINGAGKGFCAGADIKQLAALDGVAGVEFAHLGQQVLNELENLGKPSVAAIHGFAFGGGCELAMAATIRIASENAVFGQPEVKLGVIPGFGGTQRLSRLIGKGRALEHCLTGRRFGAQEAHQWGLLNEVVPERMLEEKAISLLMELVEFGPFAVKSIMHVINQGYDMTMDEALNLESAYFGLCCNTADKQEGVSAFLEKRKATFAGK